MIVRRPMKKTIPVVENVSSAENPTVVEDPRIVENPPVIKNTSLVKNPPPENATITNEFLSDEIAAKIIKNKKKPVIIGDSSSEEEVVQSQPIFKNKNLFGKQPSVFSKDLEHGSTSHSAFEIFSVRPTTILA